MRDTHGISSIVTQNVGSESEADDTPVQLGSDREQHGWINTEEWIINMEEISDFNRLRSPLDVSIFRVPSFLKQSTTRGAYVPTSVSLGPYHYRNALVSLMHQHKGRAVCRMLMRYNNKHCHEDLASMENDRIVELQMTARKTYEEKILELESQVRNTYEEKIDCESMDLARMLTWDGCFILEILRTLGGEEFPVRGADKCYEPIFEMNKINYTGFHILSDILMLENQIPLIVLQKLLHLERDGTEVRRKLFRVLVKSAGYKFYPFKYDMNEWHDMGNWLWPEQAPQQQQLEQQPQQQPEAQQQPRLQDHHLLGLLHSLIVSPPFPHDADQADHDAQNEPTNAVWRIPRAVELRNAGIKFRECNGGIKSIKFEQKSSTIYLPPIQITDYTEVLFRNLIALELCKASEINYVSCYLSLMDDLIDSEEDVYLLRKSEIVTSSLGSDAEVAELFNSLCNGVTLSRTDAFKQLKQQVYKKYKSKLKVWGAKLVKEHFSSPWRSLAVAGAILALVLTTLQTVYTIIGVKK